MTANPTYETPSPAAPATQERRLYRSRTDRVLAGLCGGIGEYFGFDPSLVRLVTVLVAILTGILPLLVVYIVAALIVPERGDGAEAAAAGIAVRPGQGALVLGVLLLIVGVIGLSNALFRIDWEVLWPVALVALGAALVLTYRSPGKRPA